MKLLTKAWATMMRRSVHVNLDCRADIYITSGAVGADGAPTEAPVLVEKNVPCAIAPWGTIAKEGVFGGKMTESLKWVVIFDQSYFYVSSRHTLVVRGQVNGENWSRSLKVVNQMEPGSNPFLIPVLCDE